MQKHHSLSRVASASISGVAGGMFLSVLAASQTVAQSQSITAAADGTGTSVSAVETADGTVFTIEQGSLSADDVNLFHSFKSFSLGVGDTADFLAQPSVHNILARVGSGAPSIIEGLLQVSAQGTNQPNLFLMNPAGVLFGAEAVLNLPASLTVTTGDAVGIGNGWFGAVGAVDYTNLIGAPSGEVAFLGAQFGEGANGGVVNGGVVNAGNLVLANESASITLLGGTVINTGTISAPGGAITLAAVPGENIVRLSQNNSLLSLELAAVESASSAGLETIAAPDFSPLDLPTLLTHVEQRHATGLSIEDNGSVRLTNTDTTIPTSMGDVIASGQLSVASVSGQGGQIAILGDRVGILGGQLNASGAAGGGNIRLGGEYRGQGPLPTAERILVDANSSIMADAIAHGDGGRVIVWSDDTTRYAGHISARGGEFSGNGGFVEVSGKVNLDFQGHVDASAPQGESGSLLLDPEEIIIDNGTGSPNDSEVSDGQILANEGSTGFPFHISEGVLEALNGNMNVRLEARSRITLRNLSDDQLLFKPGSGSITFEITDAAPVSNFATVDKNDTIATNGRSIRISGIELRLGNISTAPVGGSVVNSGNIRLTGPGSGQTAASIFTGDLITAGNVLEQNGEVRITADEIVTENIRTGNPVGFHPNERGGDVVLISDAIEGSIVTGNIDVRD